MVTRLARRLALKDGSYVCGVLRLLVALFCDLWGCGHRDGQQRWPGFSCQAKGCCFNLSLGEVRPWKKKQKWHWEPVGMEKGTAVKFGDYRQNAAGFTIAACVFSCKRSAPFLDRHYFFLEEHQSQHKHFLKTLQWYFMGSAPKSRLTVAAGLQFSVVITFWWRMLFCKPRSFHMEIWGFPGKNTYKLGTPGR